MNLIEKVLHSRRNGSSDCLDFFDDSILGLFLQVLGDPITEWTNFDSPEYATVGCLPDFEQR